MLAELDRDVVGQIMTISAILSLYKQENIAKLFFFRGYINLNLAKYKMHFIVVM